MLRMAGFALALVSPAVAVADAPSAPAAVAAAQVDNATSDIGCVVRLMVFAERSKEMLASTSDPAEQAQVRNNISLTNRGFAYFVAKLGDSAQAPDFRSRAERAFEALRGLSGEVMVQQATGCVKIWQKSENALIAKFREKP